MLPQKRCLSKYKAHGLKSNVLYSWGQHMCVVFKWFSSIDCWLDDWARILRHLTMLMVFGTNIYPLETRIWSGWSNATPVSQLFMIWGPSAIHHSWFWHHLIIQNNQLHLCKLDLTQNGLRCIKITPVNKSWASAPYFYPKKKTVARSFCRLYWTL